MSTTESIAIERPQRWDHPLDPQMTDAQVVWLLRQSPFCDMDSKRFSGQASLEAIIRNDTRARRYEPGDLIVREGDYGASAYLILTGSARAFVGKLQRSSREETRATQLGWWRALVDSFWLQPHPEQRSSPHRSADDDHLSATGLRQVDSEPRIFIQDLQSVLVGNQTGSLYPGELFGEMAAITRSAHEFSVVAEESSWVLEIRWQGLRLLRRDPGFRDYLDARYRAHSLQSHLRETWLLRFLPEEALQQVAAHAELVSYGEREWFARYQDTRQLDAQSRVSSEPMIAEESKSASDLILIRTGFARLSHLQGDGHRTLAYLGRGQIFGLTELWHNYRQQNPANDLPYQESLRAIGFVDALKIQSQIAYEYIFPYVRVADLPGPIEHPRYDPLGLAVYNADSVSAYSLDDGFDIETPLLEFLVENRLINGRQTMIVDTERCTRCDDCVKACARTHHGNPRFIRKGMQFGPLLFAHACMHCQDPVCMIGCPTGAIQRDIASGAITINPQTCIGCKTCAESCPYQNIQMVQIRDGAGRALVDTQRQLPILQATKCDLCKHQPNGPACQTACPHDALVRMDMSNLDSLHQWLGRKAA